MRPERAARLVVGLLLLLLVIAPLFANGVDLLVDWLWFGQEGFRGISLTILKSQITLSSLAGIGFMAVAGLNLLVALILCLLGAVFLYLVEGGIWVTPRGPAVGRYARAHFCALGALIFVLIAYRFRLAMYGLLYSPRGVLYGAGYADVHASVPIFWMLLFLSLATAAALLVAAAQGRLRAAILAALGLVVVGVLGGSIYPEIVQRFVVTPNEIGKERPFIARAIESTRKAYALDRFEEREFSAGEDLSLKEVRKNDATMRNVRLWDHQPLRTTFAQLQEIRTYYDFVRV